MPDFPARSVRQFLDVLSQGETKILVPSDVEEVKALMRSVGMVSTVRAT